VDADGPALRGPVGWDVVAGERVAEAAVEEVAGFPGRELVGDGDCWGEFPEPAAGAVLGPVAIAPGLCGKGVCEEEAWAEFGAAALPAPVALGIPEPAGAGLVVTGTLPGLLGPGIPTPPGTAPGLGLEFPGWPAPGETTGVPVAGLITTPPLETGLTGGEAPPTVLAGTELPSPPETEDEDEDEFGTPWKSSLPGMEEEEEEEEEGDGPRKSPNTRRCKGWSRRKNRKPKTQSSSAANTPMTTSRTRNRLTFADWSSFATAVVSETHEFLPQDGQVKRWASGCSSSAGWPQWMQRCFMRLNSAPGCARRRAHPLPVSSGPAMAPSRIDIRASRRFPSRD